jgi:hypothetical protein
MIGSLVEPGGARPGDATRRIVILTMFAYTALATIFAGAASIGAGLAVLALGLLFTLLIDMRQWRDIVAHDRRHAPPEPPRVALPSRETPRAIEAPANAPAPRPIKAIATTRLLPYARAEEPVTVAAVAEPAVVPVAPGPDPEPAPMGAPKAEPKSAPEPRRQSKRPKKA